MNHRNTQMHVMSLVVAAGLCGVAMTGCQSGNGSYTKKFGSSVALKHAAIKSATQWDMAKQAYFAGDLTKALKLVDSSISMNEDVAKSHVLRGRILLEMDRLDESLDALHRAAAINPEDVDAQYYLGVVYERIAELDKALGHYQKAADLDPENAQYVVAAAEVMIDKEQISQAETYILSRRDRFEHNPGVRQTLGHIAMMKGEYAKALRMFEQAHMLAPDDTDILEDLARTQVTLGMYRQADLNFTKLLKNKEVRATRRDLLHMHARCLVELGRFVEARDEYLGLTKGDEGAADVDAWIGLGNVASILKDNHRIRVASSRVMALAPHREEGYIQRAIYERRKGDLQAALSYLDKAIAQVDKPKGAYTMKGVVLEEMGRQDLAQESFAAAYRADPTDKTLAGLVDGMDNVGD